MAFGENVRGTWKKFRVSPQVLGLRRISSFSMGLYKSLLLYIMDSRTWIKSELRVPHLWTWNMFLFPGLRREFDSSKSQDLGVPRTFHVHRWDSSSFFISPSYLKICEYNPLPLRHSLWNLEKSSPYRRWGLEDQSTELSEVRVVSYGYLSL